MKLPLHLANNLFKQRLTVFDEIAECVRGRTIIRTEAQRTITSTIQPDGDTIPARPAIHNANGALQEQFKQASEDWQIGQSQELMERFSLQAIGIVQQSITNLKTPPNALSTQHQKGSSNPLIDTGLYRQSINADIREN